MGEPRPHLVRACKWSATREEKPNRRAHPPRAHPPCQGPALATIGPRPPGLDRKSTCGSAARQARRCQARDGLFHATISDKSRGRVGREPLPGRSVSPHPVRSPYRSAKRVQLKMMAGAERRYEEATPLPFRRRPIPRNPGDAADLSTPQEFRKSHWEDSPNPLPFKSYSKQFARKSSVTLITFGHRTSSCVRGHGNVSTGSTTGGRRHALETARNINPPCD